MTSKLCTTTTHQGLYEFKRLPFGVNVAAIRFQRLVSELLKGIKGVVALLDDILISGENVRQHNARLREVLVRLSAAGLRVHKEKSFIGVQEVQYLGHKVTTSGIQPLSDYVTAVRDAPAPTNVKELQSFLGKVNFYDRLLPNRATILAPLYDLLQKTTKWDLNAHCQRAFQTIKDTLASDTVLVRCSLDKTLSFKC